MARSVPWWPATLVDVLEVGSRNVNGSVREVIGLRARRYVGVDLEAGPGVDVVADVLALDQVPLPQPEYDIVISTEMLEHVADWCTALEQMTARVRDNGLLVLTTRSPGFEYHPYPQDNWRFTVEDMQQLFGVGTGWDLLQLETDPDPGQRHPAPYYGVGLTARKLPGPEAAEARCHAWKTGTVHVARDGLG